MAAAALPLSPLDASLDTTPPLCNCKVSSPPSVKAAAFILVAYGIPTVLNQLFDAVYYPARSKREKLMSDLRWLKQLLELECAQAQQEAAPVKKEEPETAVPKGSDDKNGQDIPIEQDTPGGSASIELRQKGKKKAEPEPENSASVAARQIIDDYRRLIEQYNFLISLISFTFNIRKGLFMTCRRRSMRFNTQDTFGFHPTFMKLQ